jgi:predicted cupin superfamily sugar epimerase
MTSRGLTDKKVDEKALVKDSRGQTRNALTSIYWVPTLQSPKLRLAINISDHVHFYQGGQPFEYIVYDPATEKLEHSILGPDVCNGHKLQVPVRGGLWKCGHMIVDTGRVNYEFSMIGEAVGPGFDVEDFTWVTIDMLEKECPIHIQKTLMAYVNEKNLSCPVEKNKSFDSYYDELERDVDGIPLSPSQNRRMFQLNYEPL